VGGAAIRLQLLCICGLDSGELAPHDDVLRLEVAVHQAQRVDFGYCVDKGLDGRPDFLCGLELELVECGAGQLLHDLVDLDRIRDHFVEFRAETGLFAVELLQGLYLVFREPLVVGGLQRAFSHTFDREAGVTFGVLLLVDVALSAFAQIANECLFTPNLVAECIRQRTI